MTSSDDLERYREELASQSRAEQVQYKKYYDSIMVVDDTDLMRQVREAQAVLPKPSELLARYKEFLSEKIRLQKLKPTREQLALFDATANRIFSDLDHVRLPEDPDDFRYPQRLKAIVSNSRQRDIFAWSIPFAVASSFNEMLIGGKKLAENVCLPFFKLTAPKEKLFSDIQFTRLRGQLCGKTFAYDSDITWKERLDELEKRRQPVTEFFKGTYFEPFFGVPEVSVSPDTPFSGTWVLAAQGYGKTTLLSKLILDRMKEPCSIIVFDSKPELSTFFRKRKFPKDVVIIDPDPFLALNPLDLGTHSLDILMYLFSSLLEAKFTPLQSVALRQAVYLTTLVPNATFSTFVDIVNNGGKKYTEVLAGLDEEDRLFWERDYDSGTYRDTKAQIIWRLNLLRPPGSRARTMFNAPKTKVRLAPLMDGNTLTIINNSIPDLGALQSEFFSRLFIVMILGAAEQRALKQDKRPCYIFMDEAHTVIANEPNISDIIYRTRSQKIALLCAHQSLSQIKDPQVISALSDCAIRYANCDNDAPSMATHMGVSADRIRGLGVGEFALAIRGTPGAQTIKVPLPDFKPYPRLTASEIQAREARFRSDYCYTPPPKPSPQSQSTETPPSGTWGGKPVI